MKEILKALDEYLDANVDPRYKDQPMAQDWARISKIGEEFGEVISAYIGATGQNPRKGIINDMDDVLDELCDTILTGFLAMQHYTKDIDQTMDIFNARLQYRMLKAGLVIECDMVSAYPSMPDHIPASYCTACIRSGVGACDDFPDCPAGKVTESDNKRS